MDVCLSLYVGMNTSTLFKYSYCQDFSVYNQQINNAILAQPFLFKGKDNGNGNEKVAHAGLTYMNKGIALEHGESCFTYFT